MKNFPFKLSASLLSLFLVVASFCQAQTARKNDIIILRDNTKLEVIIQEVQDQSIKYRKITDPEGPVFFVQKSDIVSIHYGNGETKNYEEKPEVYYDEITAPAPVTPYGKTAPKPSLSMQTISNWDANQLRANYKFYLKKADNYRKMGTVGLVGGAALTGAGIGVMASADNINGYNGFGQFLGGYMMFIAGLGSGIPLTIIGFVKKKRYTQKALLVKDELRRRKEAFAFNFSPSYNPATQSAGLSIKMSF
ncbi:hypothetical protein [Dyadobacter psychrotolerans]|uniref:Uncharacterized protein n=1 Tax=Dyadobacter psychrotolerans TaxID=2541721 RepID=A0A4R5DE34_9BACT|nr:hypothetical protein [Dyadobacter psychrotolerans]TDE08845.1 hypothetical protein E0F88_31865 [Dyadobacter psychrotolerans]